MLEIYTNIKKRRKELGYTQTELANKLGYADKSMIAKIEKGQIDLSQSKIMAFAKALETDARILMGNDGIVTDKQPTCNVFVSTNEKNLLDIYRDLDDKGQHTVDTVAQMEYERVKGGSTATNKK
ncbi:MAG: helix-turn-helix domain-containing protein [Faecalitalea cylindroides]